MVAGIVAASCTTKNLERVTVLEAHDDHPAIPVYLIQTADGDTLLGVVDPKCFEPARKLFAGAGDQQWVAMRGFREEDSLSVEYDTTYVNGVVHAFLLYRTEQAKGSMVAGQCRLIPLGTIWPKGEVIIECSQ